MSRERVTPLTSRTDGPRSWDTESSEHAELPANAGVRASHSYRSPAAGSSTLTPVGAVNASELGKTLGVVHTGRRRPGSSPSGCPLRGGAKIGVLVRRRPGEPSRRAALLQHVRQRLPQDERLGANQRGGDGLGAVPVRVPACLREVRFGTACCKLEDAS